MKSSTLVPVVFLLFSCASGPNPKGDASEIERLISQSKLPGYETRKGDLLVHSPAVFGLFREKYNADDRFEIRTALGKSLDFELDKRGLARAADRVDMAVDDPTHYDAVWVRDSLWVYLGLKTELPGKDDARRLILALSDYFASPAQRARFEAVIANPKILEGPDGAMNAVHIRFDRRSAEFADVSENGRPQVWNHKQNDALGLFLDLFCRSLLEGEITTDDLTPERAAMIGLFPRYFDAIRFESMADAGSWEEIPRLNTSSVALVTSGLERLERAKRFFPAVPEKLVWKLIDRGYRTITRQLTLGGESPGYAKNDPRYREADAALLNLIYPARLSRLRRKDFATVLRAVAPLVGEVGVKRYLGDSYQSGNFWFESGKTDDTSSDSSFAERGSKFIPGSEAQWFFDSWYSLAAGILAKRYDDSKLEAESARFLGRALAQITGGTPDAPVLGADAKPVPALALPESYNVIVDRKSGARAYAPSPITPLNWAKAAMRLALSAR